MPLNRNCVRLLDRHSRGKHPFQPDVVDIGEILPQGRVGGLVLPQNGRAEVRALLPKETELSFLAATSAKPIDFYSNGEYAEHVGIVQRDGKAQDGEVPRPYHPGVPFMWFVA